jgi:hypothetical protein
MTKLTRFQRFNQKFNGLVEFESSHLLNFLFDGYIDALLKHHRMETFNDFDPDLDGAPTVAVLKSDLPTITPESKSLPSEVGGKENMKNKKRNQRKRAAEKTKKKEEATTSVPHPSLIPAPELRSSSKPAWLLSRLVHHLLLNQLIILHAPRSSSFLSPWTRSGWLILA